MKIKLPGKAFLLTFFIAFISAISAQTPRLNFNRNRTYDVEHYIIRLSFDRANRKVFGDTTVQLKPIQNDFKSLELDAAQMSFDSVKLESSGKDLDFRQSGEKIIITLDKPYATNDSISVRFRYSTVPTKGIYFSDERREGETLISSAQIWTQNEPERAHFWFPSYDFPDDKATSEEFITVDAGETAIGNGELLETLENKDGTKTFHYKMPVRHATYVTSFIVGKYSKSTDSYKKIPLGFYVYPLSESIVQPAFGKTKDMMRVFEDLTGIDFPFNKYDQTMVSGFDEFSAMENITATTFSDRDVFIATFNAETKDLVEDTVSHELAHSWFGNLVTCKNWAELWLNEGFATFMEAAYREKMYGREQYLRAIGNDAEEYFSDDLPHSKRHGLYNLLAKPDDSIFDVTAYQKGGAVIHTLRETIGDKAFWKAINIYLKRNKFDNVETSDLQKAMEETSGKDLNWFFAQWVYGGGHPKLEVEPVFYTKTKTLVVKITQTQDSDKLVPAVFVLPLEIEITTEKGVKTETIRLDKREQSFSIKLDSQPQNIELDKNLKIPLKTVKFKALETSDKKKL